MGVFEEAASRTPGMHWQQHDQYLGPAYDPSRDLSPNLPSCDSSMGDAEPSISSSSTTSTAGGGGGGANSTTSGSSGSSACSTPSNNNHVASTCGSETCHRPPEVCTPHGSFEHHIPKLEPLQTPPSPPPHHHRHHHHHYHHHHGDPTACAGCGLRIADRFYLQAVDRRWHAACLQCCQCRNPLDGEVTCFSRDGNIYCKKDYYRLFGMKRCGRCHATILSSELVMRARESVFHVHCFSCAECAAPLTKGDHFGMRDGEVLCRQHFELALAEEPHAPIFHHHHTPHHHGGGGGGGGGGGDQTPVPQHFAPPFPSPDYHPHHHPPPPANADSKVPFFNGAPATPRQKGRPRKRKPKDLEAMTANLDINSDYLDMPFGRSPGGHMGGNQRTKRMRTSFKHHQLRTMKSYFAINHNPDAKDLKQLSQKTGLPKRVLQVWFQNARAKWRRMMLKQEGKSDKCSSIDGLSDLDLYPGPGSMAGSIQSLNAHSPPFMLPPGSPSSLDC